MLGLHRLRQDYRSDVFRRRSSGGRYRKYDTCLGSQRIPDRKLFRANESRSFDARTTDLEYPKIERKGMHIVLVWPELSLTLEIFGWNSVNLHVLFRTIPLTFDRFRVWFLYPFTTRLSLRTWNSNQRAIGKTRSFENYDLHRVRSLSRWHFSLLEFQLRRAVVLRISIEKEWSMIGIKPPASRNSLAMRGIRTTTLNSAKWFEVDCEG